MKLTDELLFKLLQITSGHILTSNYPDDWDEMSLSEQHSFIEDNLCSEVSAGNTIPDILDNIEIMTDVTASFIEGISIDKKEER